jgi:hypothetical protein
VAALQSLMTTAEPLAAAKTVMQGVRGKEPLVVGWSWTNSPALESGKASLEIYYSDADNMVTYAGIAARAPATAMAMNDDNAKKPMSIKCK